MTELLIQELVELNGPLYGQGINSCSSVSGGCINDSWKITLDNGKELFLKTNSLDAFKLLKSEADGLAALRKFSDPRFLIIPKPIALCKLKSFSVLLMPWLSLSGNNQSLLGIGLANLHKISSQKGNSLFGWESESFLGSNSQKAGWRDNWGECFFELRLMPQLQASQSWGLQILSFQKISALLVSYLNEHKPVPTMVHGDLWSGNALVQYDGKGVILDPATWWADREVDIAMTKLFGGFSKDFYSSYQSIWPLDNNSTKRIDIYNLYHLLNHANLFGGSYKQQCINVMTKIEHNFSKKNI